MFNAIGIALLMATILYIVDVVVDINHKLKTYKINRDLKICKNALAITILSVLNDCLLDAKKQVKNTKNKNTKETK